ncbi:uncharacterized protein LOC130736370 [Lotus japonicus]|uniref:uncharacterized protein LOC130736370 n=1 Tax=Lotus japonicus TaxID=34305 RepID=UPI002587B068|nr:uncharacterized protein LOC130736370 [Lotus japonicus]
MSQSSRKDDSVKTKVERTAKGVKCMGLKSGSSQPSSVSKKAPKPMRPRYPTRKVYRSQVQNRDPTHVPLYEDVTDEEEINAEDALEKSPHVDVPNVETSASQENSDQEKKSTSHEDSGNVTKPDVSVSSPSKDDDLKNGDSEDTNSEEPILTPVSVEDISDDDSDDVPLTESFVDSVVARMKKKRRVSSPEVTLTPQKGSQVFTYNIQV